MRGGPFVRWKHTEEDIATIKKLIESEMYAREKIEEISKPEKRARETDSDSEDKPTRHGIRWTPQEVALLKDCAMEDGDLRIHVLVKKFQRTPDAINSKIYQILSQSIKSQTLEEISQKLKRPVSELQDILDKKRDFFLL